ncbi:hypothetical protein ACMAY8_07165 [Rhodobacteraceae bacterium nBUS_22]
MTDELNSFHITQIILVIFAAIFWLQIYIRGFAFRSYKFEYGAYSIIVLCGAYGYITHLMWVEDQPVLTLAGFFWIGYAYYKAWKRLTGRTSWQTMEADFGPQSVSNLVADDAKYFRGKGLVELFLKLFGQSGTYYGTLSFVTLLSLLVFYL